MAFSAAVYGGFSANQSIDDGNGHGPAGLLHRLMQQLGWLAWRGQPLFMVGEYFDHDVPSAERGSWGMVASTGGQAEASRKQG